MPKNDPTHEKRLDPAVSGLLAGMEQRQAELQLPRRERERIVRERLKIQARREQRATYDLPPVLREELRDLAESLGIPASQLAALALARFLVEYHENRIDLDEYKQPSRSPRYDWNLVFPDALVPKNRKRKSGVN
jgi:hypothetical protein